MPSQTPVSTRYVKAEVRVLTECPWHINQEQTGLSIVTVVLHAGTQSNCNNLLTIVSVVLWDNTEKYILLGPKAWYWASGALMKSCNVQLNSLQAIYLFIYLFIYLHILQVKCDCSRGVS